MSAQKEMSFQQKSLFQQGYQTYTPAQLKELEWGLRFTPAACSLVALYGLLTVQPMILFAVALLGIWAFFAPSAHPMDLLYNHVVRHLFGSKVTLPPNPFQRRLACFSAGLMNTISGSLMLLGMNEAAWIVGGMLLALQAIVIFTHFCTLSWMYEGLMRLLGRWSVPIALTEAQNLLAGGAQVIDVRGPDEFANGHLPGALNLPLEELEHHLSVFKDSVSLLYCNSGTRSQIAMKKLKQLAVDNVHDLGAFNRASQVVAQPA